MNIEMPHRRLNPLTGEWVLVSPHRTKRPWLGQVEKVAAENLPPYDPTCYLCPGNERAAGKTNPAYTGTFVFENDFPALLPYENGDSGAKQEGDALFQAAPEYGTSRVVCFSPRHDLSLPELSQTEVEAVIQTWASQTRELNAWRNTEYVQVFENKGAMMGASNPHPHSQIWASSRVPGEPAKELANLQRYQTEHGSCLLCDYLAEEQRRKERLVTTNDHFSALVPFWAVWPFEVMLIAHRHMGSLTDLTPEEVSGLADILRKVTARYDNLFEISFPYSMGFHQSPANATDGLNHLHAHYYPPLLRSATVRKFMVGYEMLGNPQRDLTPEAAAARLRELSEVHYKQRQG